MRLAALGVLAALLTAPLAAQAAQQPTRFAVTLQGKIVDALSCDRTIVGDDCIILRTGTGGRELTIRSLRPTTIEVAGGSRVASKPARVSALRVTATTRPGPTPRSGIAGSCRRRS
jgi:type 1 fimbria pilin